MKLPYIPDPPLDLSAEDQAVYERIRRRRGLAGLLPLDRSLLHSPKLADGWNSLLGAVRTQSTLSEDIREICICRPAIINKAWFEWIHHAPLLEAAEGVTPAKMAVVRQPEPQDQGALSDRQWAVLRYADAMTRQVAVADDLFKQLNRVGFSYQEIVEITITCATYNMVSRFLVALDVGEANGAAPPGLGSQEGK